MVLYNSKNRFEGTPEEIVLSIFRTSEEKMARQGAPPQFFEDWWKGQQKNLKSLSGFALPDWGRQGAAEAFINFYREKGALSEDPPSSPRAPGV